MAIENATPVSNEPHVEIHVSGIRQFMKCRYLWDLTDFSRKNRILRDEDTQAFFLRGTACHKWWEAYYTDNKHDEHAAWEAYGKYWKTEAQSFHGTRLHTDTTLMLRHYLLSLATREKTNTIPDSDIRFIKTEQKFRIAITNPITRRPLRGAYYAGTFDGIVEYKGGIYIWENKTSSMPDKLLRSIDTHDNQSRLYVLAARTLFPNVKGIIYNVMKSAVPSEPEQLAPKKDDPPNMVRWSQNKKWGGSYSYFRSLFPGPIPPDYLDFVNHTIANEDNWFKRRVVHPDPATNMEMLIELYEIAKEMMRKDLPIWKARDSFVCDKCSFYSHCYEGVSLDDISMPRGRTNEW